MIEKNLSTQLSACRVIFASIQYRYGESRGGAFIPSLAFAIPLCSL